MPLHLKLRNEAKELLTEASGIQKLADDENRKLTEVEDKKIKALLADHDEKMTEADQREAIHKRETAAATDAANVTGAAQGASGLPGASQAAADGGSPQNGSGGGTATAIAPPAGNPATAFQQNLPAAYARVGLPGAPGGGLSHRMQNSLAPYGGIINVMELGAPPEDDSWRGASQIAAGAKGSLGVGSIPAVVIDHEAEGRFGFMGLADFAICCVKSRNPSQHGLKGPDPRLIALQQASGGSQEVGSSGGFLVPPTFATTIWDGMNQDPLSLLAMTDQFTVTGEKITFPANAETDRTNGTLFGGVFGKWLREAGEIPSSFPTYREITIEPQEFAVFMFQTDKLLRNSPVALEQFLTRAASQVINFAVGNAIFDGDGSGKPLGILRSNALITVAKEAGQLADTIVFDNIVKMYARLHTNARVGAVWFINQDIEPQLWKLQLEGVSTSTPVFLPPGGGMFGGLTQAPFGTILGLPVIPLEYSKTLGDAGDIVLANMRFYTTGIRGGVGGGVRSATSIHLRFEFLETAFRFVFEIDGRPWLNSPITPANGPNTLSAFVQLAARA